MAHYLLAVSPLRGHVMPMVTVGEGLGELGHDVTVLTGEEYRGLATDAGLRMVALPPQVHIAAPSAPPAALRHLPTQLRRFWLGRRELAEVFAQPLAAEAAALRRVLDDHPVDGVLVDVTFTGALPLLLGEAARPPIVVCGVGPLTVSSADIPPFGMAWRPAAGTDYRPMTWVAHHVIMRASHRRLDHALRQAGSRPSPAFVSDWPLLADGVVQLSVREFEYARGDLAPTVDFVGPVLPAPTGPVQLPDWWGDVEAARTVVHVTQGTFDNTDVDQLIAPTLEALGGRDDVLIVVTTARPDAGLLTRIPSNAHVAEWLPYSVLMPHVDVMITNGGYGGVQYALAHGVPLIVAGETSDKAEVAARVEHTGVGIDLRTATPSAAAIGAAVSRVLGEGTHRAAARRLQAAIAASTPVDAIANVLKGLTDAREARVRPWR